MTTRNLKYLSKFVKSKRFNINAYVLERSNLKFNRKPTLIDKGFGSKTVYTPIKIFFSRKLIEKVLFCCNKLCIIVVCQLTGHRWKRHLWRFRQVRGPSSPSSTSWCSPPWRPEFLRRKVRRMTELESRSGYPAIRVRWHRLSICRQRKSGP